MDQIECVVIGAGVVGLAVARALAARGREVIVLEAAEAIGVGTSSRNSEVIHAGIYYPRGSLKAALCVRGREMLYDYCVEHNVPHSRCGKLLVATSRNQVPQLESIMAKGRENGVLDLMRITGDQAKALEPRSNASRRCFRRRRASSTVTSSCWRFRAMPSATARCSRSMRRSTAIEASDGRFIIKVGGDAPTRSAPPV